MLNAIATNTKLTKAEVESAVKRVTGLDVRVDENGRAYATRRLAFTCTVFDVTMQHGKYFVTGYYEVETGLRYGWTRQADVWIGS